MKADFGYIVDGDGPVGRIANQSPSKMDLDFTVKGKAAHAGRPEKGINAIAVASSAIARIKSGRIDEDTTANIGLISGGMDANVFSGRGLPCIGLGMGAENEHTPDEFISISQLREGARFIKTLLTTAVQKGLEKV